MEPGHQAHTVRRVLQLPLLRDAPLFSWVHVCACPAVPKQFPASLLCGTLHRQRTSLSSEVGALAGGSGLQKRDLRGLRPVLGRVGEGLERVLLLLRMPTGFRTTAPTECTMFVKHNRNSKQKHSVGAEMVRSLP